MKHPLLLFVALILLLPPVQAASSSSSYTPPGCDTLRMADGLKYLVHITWQNEAEIQYTLCDEPGGKVYTLKRTQIRSITKGSADKAPATSLRQKGRTPVDSFDILKLTNGEKHRVIILTRDYLNTYYRLYDNPADDREYCVPNSQVRYVERSRFSDYKEGKKSGSGCLIALAIIGGLILFFTLIGLLLA